MCISLSIAGKVALITGGSRGIGAACVRMFIEAGGKVVFNYRSSRAQADKLVRACGAERCLAMPCDLSAAHGAQDLVAGAVQRFGRLDLVVANHGIWPAEEIPVEQMTEQHWVRTIANNLNSVFAVIKHAVAQMKRQAGGSQASSAEPEQPVVSMAAVDPGPFRQAAGRIVLISSTAGQRGEAYHCDYAASKGALISMAKGLATELAPHSIYVNCVAPGWIATELSAPALSDPQRRERIFRAIPLGRVGLPEEVAAPVLFLCTDHAGFITGEVFNVNGGAVLAG